MRLILVRHGQTDSNVSQILDTGHPGAPLNAKGNQQALQLTEQLADLDIDGIYSSDLTRAIQTAAPLAAALEITPIADPGFREIFAGEQDQSADSQPYVDVLSQWPKNPAACLPGAENFFVFERRWRQALAKIEANAHQQVIIISHGAALRIWVTWVARNLSVDQTINWPLQNIDRICLEGSSATGWIATAWGQRLITQ